jgi:hypothetical protein
VPARTSWDLTEVREATWNRSRMMPVRSMLLIRSRCDHLYQFAIHRIDRHSSQMVAKDAQNGPNHPNFNK